METELFDVMVTVGHERASVRDSMLERIVAENQGKGVGSPNSYLTGKGKWGEYEEHSGALLYTDMTIAMAADIRASAQVTGYVYEQEAVGVFIVAAGSALVHCKDRG